MPKPHKFDRSVLREYDIRGLVGKTLHEADARAVGAAFGSVVRERGGRMVCVGRDGRLSSPKFEAAIVAGLASVGVEACRIGVGPTPMLYFSVHHHAADAGIMVTGSHNPPEYNGFKMMLGKAAFYGEEIQALGVRAAKGDFASGQAGSRDVPTFDAYVDRLAEESIRLPAFTIAWDAGNGACGPAMQALTRRLKGRHHLLNETIDGTFPAHHPDPTVPKNLEQIIALVRREKCDAGLAFDGDGDRLGAVDGEGRILWADQIMALIAREVVRERPGATIIADVKSSQVLFDLIASFGGKPLMWKTGHSLIKAKMAETGSPFSGEMSGHLFFADRWYGFDDALYAGLRLLDAVALSGKSLAQLRDELPQTVNTPELRFQCPDDLKFAVVKAIRERLKSDGAEVNDIDGVRVKTRDGWWLLRASNTQDVLVARCEAGTIEGLARLKADLLAALAPSGIELPRI
jgi:phosphomannomutase